ncbi:unnamed protein product [Parnassius apollo]|uniref:(apollo) hypothetical protein n=1 Tax=Parnassius apollo TaxID=110799 RepID=A0A8S3XE03_PARAO|nr:unnamed protein product [Parnassius apollo]
MDESDLENLEDMLDNKEKDLENYKEILDDVENYQNDDLQTETNNSDDYDDLPTSTVVTGQWVLVKFTTKSSLKHYVGIVSSVNYEGIPTVKYVRKSAFRGNDDNTAFVYPDVPDVCELRHLDDIVCKLPNPIIGRRGKIFFKVSFKGYNII